MEENEKKKEGNHRHYGKDRVDGTRMSSINPDRALSRINTSGVRGVSYNSTLKKWQASIGFQGKRITLGRFNTKEEAVKARKDAEEKYYKPCWEKNYQPKEPPKYLPYSNIVDLTGKEYRHFKVIKYAGRYRTTIKWLCQCECGKEFLATSTENLLQRHFKVEIPGKVFVTDVTEFNLGKIGKVYLSPVMDLYNREIVGYDKTRHPDFAQTRRMMKEAFEGRKIAEGALFHSDQGWQYQMKEFGDMLADLGITQSMSRKGNCHDNAVMENFFGRLKVEMFYGEEDTFTSYEDFRKRLAEYIDWYNRSRIKEYLQWKSPYQVLSTSVTL